MLFFFSKYDTILLEKIKKDKELREKVMIIVERKDVVYKLRPDVEIVSNI